MKKKAAGVEGGGSGSGVGMDPDVEEAFRAFVRPKGREVAFALLGWCAQEEEWAARLLHSMAVNAVHALTRVCAARPKMFREIAGRALVWPVFWGSHPEIERDVRELVGSVGLGRDLTVNLGAGKRGWSFDTVETRVAFQLFGELRHLREVGYCGFMPRSLGEGAAWEAKVRALPPLSRQSYKEWFGAAMPLFEQRYGGRRGRFEDGKEFKHYWRNAAYRGEKNARALIRRDIKAKIKQAFRSIAPKVERGAR